MRHKFTYHLNNNYTHLSKKLCIISNNHTDASVLVNKVISSFFTLHLFSITANVVYIPECVFTDCMHVYQLGQIMKLFIS